ncbi:MAG: ATP-binding protein [Gammaproteobacteria bacterium]|nr:ATP-binding protein [Gammaproteobacteria bacterium]
MFKLFLRFYLSLLVIMALISVYSNQLLFFDNPFVFETAVNDMSAGLFSPTYRYIQAQLLTTPESSWAETLHKLTPSQPHIPINIIPLDQVHVTKKQYQRLVNGQMIGFVYFFHAPITNTTTVYYGVTYQRIGHSDKALEFINQQRQDYNGVITQAWLMHFIDIELKKSSQDQQTAVLRNLSQQLGVPIQIIPLSQLTPEMIDYLQKQQYLYDSPSSFSEDITHFYWLYKPDKVISVGPYPYSFLLTQIAPIFLLFSIVTVLLFMLFSLYTFYKDLKKLDRMAESYGDGNFSSPVKMSRFAAMYPLYINLKTMGARIERLIASHKELTQAVSHELKTPLARLKFALAISQESKNPLEINKALIDANEAVNNLEHLINELLLYTRFDRQLFDLAHEEIWLGENLRALLADLTYEVEGKSIINDISLEIQQCKIKMAEPYFKILIQNLLSNAFRYAYSRIIVKAYVDRTQVIIEIADDGPGVPLDAREKIFEPFYSLDESRNKELSGHGLGLAIVARIVAIHNGKVEVKESPTLQGALFIISLPLVA